MANDLNTVRIRLVMWKCFSRLKRILGSTKESHVFLLAIYCGHKTKLASCSMETYPSMTAFTVTLCAFPIHHVDALRYYPQIGPSVIKRIVVPMVNL